MRTLLSPFPATDELKTGQRRTGTAAFDAQTCSERFDPAFGADHTLAAYANDQALSDDARSHRLLRLQDRRRPAQGQARRPHRPRRPTRRHRHAHVEPRGSRPLPPGQLAC